MASATTKAKDPNGNIQEKKVISYFEDKGLNINVIVFDTGRKENGHNLVEVSYLSDGKFQKIEDGPFWDKDVKGLLVKGIHGQAGDLYRLAPDEILVSENPARSLLLRDANYESLIANYAAYLDSLNQNANASLTEAPIPAPAVNEEQVGVNNGVYQDIVPDSNLNVGINSAPQGVSQVPEGNNITNMPAGPQESINQTSLDSLTGVQTPAPAINGEQVGMNNGDIAPVSDLGVGINPAPQGVGQVPDVNNMMNMPAGPQESINQTSLDSLTGVQTPAPAINGEQAGINNGNIAPAPDLSVGINSAPQGVGQVPDGNNMMNMSSGPQESTNQTSLDSLTSIQSLASAGNGEQVGMNNGAYQDIVPAPDLSVGINLAPQGDGQNINNGSTGLDFPSISTPTDSMSAGLSSENIGEVQTTAASSVTDSYAKEFAEVIAQARKTTEEYTAKFANLTNGYMNEMATYEQKAEELNKQAQARNELAGQTLASYQNMSMNQPQNVQNITNFPGNQGSIPNAENGQILARTAA